ILFFGCKNKKVNDEKMIKILEITGTFFAGFISDIGITLFSTELTYNIS
mgnify:CR=1